MHYLAVISSAFLFLVASQVTGFAKIFFNWPASDTGATWAGIGHPHAPTSLFSVSPLYSPSTFLPGFTMKK